MLRKTNTIIFIDTSPDIVRWSKVMVSASLTTITRHSIQTSLFFRFLFLFSGTSTSYVVLYLHSVFVCKLNVGVSHLRI